MAGRIKALSLYKSILRAHDRFLPHSMRQLGDAYVKAEFRLHKTAQPEQTARFFTEWEKYLEHVERTGRENQSMDAGLVDKPPIDHNSASSANIMSNNDNGNNNIMNNSFGKDMEKGVEFSEEQVGQLEKLREEAVKAKVVGK